MQPLTAGKLLAVWERGRPQHPLDRALTLLAAVTPNTTRDELADLSIGERDARLLQLRTLLLGPDAEGFVECPRCAERLEFPLATAAFAQPRELPRTLEPLACAGAVIPFRLPTSRDLAEVAAAPDEETALRRLVARCSTGANALPDESLAALGQAILAADPQAEIALDFTCPACAHRWDLLFDIADFLWTEIAAQAQRLLREIDALARAYGWSEDEILALPAARRQTYLDLLAA